MTHSLYELDYNLRQLDAVMSQAQDEETLQILEDTKNVLLPQIEESALDILTYIGDCQARAKHLKDEAVRIAKKAKALDGRAEWLKNLLKTHMQMTNQEKATYGIYDVSLAKTPDRVVITDENCLPDELCTITRTANKTAIKERMTDGKLTANVDGKEIELAHLESSTTIRIK